MDKRIYYSVIDKSFNIVGGHIISLSRWYRGIEYFDELTPEDKTIIDNWIKMHESPLLLTIYGVEVDD